jgi:hypothetical protein
MKIERLNEMLVLLKVRKKDLTAEDIVNEVLKETSSPSYWKGIRNESDSGR